MAGKKPKRVYVYDKEGGYICMFNTLVEFRSVYYPNDVFKRPIFNHEELGYKYSYMEDLELIALTSRSAGRELIKRIVAIHESEYCKKSDNDPNEKPVQVFNLKQELIAEFKTMRLMTKLLPHINQSTISRHLKNKNIKMINESGLFFKYKE
jgi:hypothetical protein